MATVFKLQFCIIIIICFYSRSFYSFKLPYDGAKVVTYGEPCHSPRYLPVTIEEVAKPVTELVSPTSPCAYRPLKLNYRVTDTDEPAIPHQPQAEYPISIQVPRVPEPLEIITPDPFRGKSYMYDIQDLPTPAAVEPYSPRRYNFDFQLPPSPISEVPTPQSIKLLTGLTSKIDRVLIPACQVPSSSCCGTAL